MATEKDKPAASTYDMSNEGTLKKYLAIEALISRGRVPSDEDQRFLMEHTPQNEQELADLQEQIQKAQDKGIVPKELQATAIFKTIQGFMQTPAYKEHLAGMIADQKAGKLSDRLNTALNLTIEGSHLAQGINQVVQGRNIAQRSLRPGKPAAISADQNLAQALRQGQEGTYDVSRQLAPAQAAAQDQYNEDIQNAKTASAGQSGAFGAYTQVAANRRNRAGLEQSALGSQIMQQNRANYNQLLGLKQNENRNIFESQSQFYPTDLHQYQLEQQAAANLGNVGYRNINNAAEGFGQAGVNLGVDIARQRKLASLHAIMDQYGHGPTATTAHTQLENNFKPTPLPAYEPWNDYMMEQSQGG